MATIAVPSLDQQIAALLTPEAFTLWLRMCRPSEPVGLGNQPRLSPLSVYLMSQLGEGVEIDLEHGLVWASCGAVTLPGWAWGFTLRFDQAIGPGPGTAADCLRLLWAVDHA